MIINLATIDFNGGGGGGNAKPAVLQEKSIGIQSNGSQTVVPDEGYDGLSSVDVNVAITGASSAIDFSTINYDAKLSAELNAKWNNDVAYSKTLYDKWNLDWTNTLDWCRYDTKLVYAPHIDTSKITSVTSMFNGCTSLTTVPAYNTSNVRSMSGMFYGCTSLTSVLAFDTSKVTDMTSMFTGCSSITSVPEFDTSNVTDMTKMFYACSRLTSVPEFDTSKVTNMSYMFNGCTSLTSVLAFDTSNATNMEFMFQGCSNLTSVPAFDTSNATKMTSMFDACSNLTSVPAFDTSNATTMQSMFNKCSSLTSVGGISVKSISGSTIGQYYLFGYSKNTSIKKAVIKDIGYQSKIGEFNTTYCENWGVNSDEIPDARQSLIDSLITYSFDRTSAGYSTCAIKLSKTTFALLTDDEKAQITAKGYTVASA